MGQTLKFGIMTGLLISKIDNDTKAVLIATEMVTGDNVKGYDYK